MPSLIFRKGLDLKHAVAGMLAESYHSAITGLNESTVRVHLFRAVRKLRSLLGGRP